MSNQSDVPEAGNGDENGDENESILEWILKSLGDMVSLEIKTLVGETTINPKDNTPNYPTRPKAMYTKIHLLDGDITTIYDPEFITGEYTSLREFHQEREKQGQQIIQDNLKAIHGLIKLLKGENLQD